MALSRQSIAALFLSTALCLPAFAQDKDQKPSTNQSPAPTLDLENPDLDADPLTKDQVNDVKRNIDNQAPDLDANFDPNNPPAEVRTAVDQRLAQLQQQYDDMQKKYDELAEMRGKDKESYDKRVEELERSVLDSQIDSTKARIDALEAKRGIAQALNDVNKDVEEATAPPVSPEGGSTGNAGGANNTFPEGQMDGDAPVGSTDTLPAPSESPDAGLPSNPPEKKPTWWEKLLKKAAEGAGKGLGKLLKKELGKLRNKADAFINEEGDKNPKYKTWIAKAIREGADNILSGKYADKVPAILDKVGIDGGSSNTGSSNTGIGNDLPGTEIPSFPGTPETSTGGQNPALPPVSTGSNSTVGTNQNPGQPTIINNGGTVIINNGASNQYHPQPLPPIPPSPRVNRQPTGSGARLTIDIKLGK
ncbi:MAG: hypothetical protein P1V97_13260 [Planctomycetota bacterium]|nr:hypothetical protein [Planctomycetota bacterium]